jgi:hypothetical protein
MTAAIIPFPGVPAVIVCREYPAWLVICGDHGWLHGSSTSAKIDAFQIAADFGARVVVRP